MLWVDLFIIWLSEDYSRIWAIPLTHNVSGENSTEVYIEVAYGEMKRGGNDIKSLGFLKSQTPISYFC